MSSPQERLDKIQSNTLECMNIAADVMELLQSENHDAPSLKAKVEHFLKKVIDSQNALSAMAKAHQPSVELEQTTYYYLAEAHAVYEKAKYVQTHLREAIAVLEPRRSSDIGADDSHPRTPMEF
eukprot:jgi/Ulvmu1/9692/UM055_0030.1